MAEPKYKLITFRVERSHLDRIDRLAKKFDLGRSETIRLALDEAVAKHLEPGFKGEIVVVDKKALDSLLTALHSRIEELDPQAQAQMRARKGLEAGQKAYELYGQGKKEEAKKLVKASIDKGIVPIYFEWGK